MEAYDAILSKKDTRAYSERPIPEETVRHIIQAGRMAGSSKNTQPVRLVVITDPARREAIAACGDFAKHVPSAPLVIAVILLPDGGAFDAGRAAQNMMLAAWSEGVTSCPTSMHHQEQAQQVLGLPEGHHVQIVLPFGFPAEEARARESRPRIGIDDFVHKERW